MQARTYFSTALAHVSRLAPSVLLVGLSSFAACGGGQSAPSSPPSPEPVASAAPANIAPSGPDAPPAATSPSLAAAASSQPPAPPPSTPDRNMDDIRAVVASNRDAFRACYDRSLKTHPGIKGKFVLKFVVNPDGTVKSAEADPTKSEIHASDLESCAVGALKGLKFPPSKKGMESTVNYPFDFNPKGPPPQR